MKLLTNKKFNQLLKESYAKGCEEKLVKETKEAIKLYMLENGGTLYTKEVNTTTLNITGNAYFLENVTSGILNIGRDMEVVAKSIIMCPQG